MNEDKELGNILRYKLSENEFPFDENNWKKAETMIASYHRKRKRRWAAGIVAAAFIGGSSLAFLLMNNSISDKETRVEKISGTAMPILNPGLLAGNEKKEEKNLPKLIIPKTTSLSKEVSFSEKRSIKNKQLKASPSELKNSDQESAKISAGDLVIAPTVKVTTGKEEKEEEVLLSSTKTKDNFIDVTTTVDGGSIDNENSHGKNLAQVEMIIKKEKEETSYSANNRVQEQTQGSNVEPIEISSINTPVLQAIEDSIQVEYLETGLVEKEIKAEEAVSPQPVLTKQHLFTLEAGGSYQLGWKDPGQEANGLNPLIGVNYIHKLNRWAGAIGLQYNTTGHLKNNGFTATTTEYNFGVTTKTTTIAPLRIYYLAVPINVLYFINDKNMIGMGCNSVFLVNTLSEVKTSQKGNYKNSEPNRSTKKGYMEGFNSFDLQLSLTYKRMLIGDVGMSAELFYGLGDVKEDSFFNTKKIERNAGLKLTIYYNLKNIF